MSIQMHLIAEALHRNERVFNYNSKQGVGVT